MNDSFEYNIDTIAVPSAETSCVDTMQSFENQYKDFKFVAERPHEFRGPQLREVTYISAGWNFITLFVAMIFVTLNKFFAPQRFSSVISMTFRSSGGEKMARENDSFVNIVTLFVIVSFVMMVSLLIQKIFVIYGGDISYDSFSFFVDIMIFVTAIIIFNYLITTFYGWLFKADSLIFLHVNLHVSVMAMSNLVIIPVLMILLFYPYKSFLVFLLVILALFYLLRFSKLLIEVRMLSKLNFVNIFLYLCTVEILPLLVISKVIIDAI